MRALVSVVSALFLVSCSSSETPVALPTLEASPTANSFEPSLSTIDELISSIVLV